MLGRQNVHPPMSGSRTDITAVPGPGQCTNRPAMIKETEVKYYQDNPYSGPMPHPEANRCTTWIEQVCDI